VKTGQPKNFGSEGCGFESLRARILIVILTAVLVVSAWLGWKCLRDPKISFLPGDRRAEWIVFPTAIDARSHPVAMMDATFRRTFTLNLPPKAARLEVRAAKRVELKINGESIPPSSIQNWKQVSTLDVANFLRSGENKIEARVFNDTAPPALWMLLTADAPTLASDGSWEASIAGSSWRKCAIASVPRTAGAGNLLAGGERISEALPKIWRSWIVFGIFAVLLTIVLDRWIKDDSVNLSRSVSFAAIGLCVFAWAALFWNNAKMLPFHTGYDFKDHVAYIKYIQERGALPLPNEGYEMFQPPLFYVISAGLLSMFHLSTGDADAARVLRVLTMLFGIANFIFALLCMRLLFPQRAHVQVIGLITAAFLPMQLYLSHYVTNEVFAAALATLSIYLGLRVLMADRASIWQLLPLGISVGAAMLAKATTLLLVPPLLGALAIKCWQQRAGTLNWVRTIGVPIAAILLTCGWHYVRIWRHFGTPIVGNWDPILGFPWWQDPGFHTAADYFRFGRALVAPMFCAFHGFADGIYSTLWGDSLGGGLSGLQTRTPWNYSLMFGGYWLAIVPTVLVIVGVVVATYRFIVQLSTRWFLMLATTAAVLAALVFMTLSVPSYAQVKAFYGLAALVPFCACAALGFQFLTSRSRPLRFAVSALVFFFAINSLASFWIRPSSQEHIYASSRAISQLQPDWALSEATKAVENDPFNSTTLCFLGAVLRETGDLAEAISACERGLQLDAKNGDCHFHLGLALGKQGDFIRGLAEARRALELQPDNARAYDLAFTLTQQLHQSEQALVIGRDALAVSPFEPGLHYRIGLAAGEIGDVATAAHQFAYALLLAPKRSDVADKLHLALRFAAQSLNGSSRLKEIAVSPPDSPPLLNELAWIFATDPYPILRDGGRAIDLAQRATALTERKQPGYLATAAAAYAETGRFSEAIASARDAAALAQAQGDTKTAEVAERMLTSFRSNQPYREERPR
jgi:tetratricopeptide (TPR) repeat protein